MTLALLVAASVHWVTLPNDKSPEGYIGWKLDEKRIIELDSRLQLPGGAYPREQYVRYYSGHIAPDGTRTLFVALVHERLKLYRPGTPPKRPGIYINYIAKGQAFVPSGFHMGCLIIGGRFNAEYKQNGPLVCSGD